MPLLSLKDYVNQPGVNYKLSGFQANEGMDDLNRLASYASRR